MTTSCPTDYPQTRRRFLRSAAAVFAAARLPLFGAMFENTACAGSNALSAEGELESLSRANGWINSPALSAAELRGKVVLVQFWTFTCINWLRTAPYVRAWANKYRDAGLIVIGAHAPEFVFEHDIDNVKRASRELDVQYPVAIDNDFAIWNAFGNQFWPALYLIDAKGHQRYHHFGEGEYDKTERMIQDLLRESGATHVPGKLSAVEPTGIELAADWAHLRTGETYLGYERGENFASPGGVAEHTAHVYALPKDLRMNQWALTGDWTIRSGAITLDQPNGTIAMNVHARDVNLVMGPPQGVRPVRFRVLLDGQPATTAHGSDVDAQGNGIANVQRVYQLLRQPMPIDDRVFQIEFLDPGVEAYAFTFG